MTKGEVLEILETAHKHIQENIQQDDYCCCGDRIDDHDIGSGHSPVEAEGYYTGLLLERLERASQWVLEQP